MAGEKIGSPYGTFPSTYRCVRLADVCVEDGGVQTGPFGSQLHQRDYVSVGTPIITVEHLGENRIIHQDLPNVSKDDKKRLSRYSLQSGDIVFSRVGSVDLRALVREDEVGWLFSGRLLRVRPKCDLIDSGYLSWFFGLPSFREYIRQIAFGATMPSLNTKILSDLPVCFPSIVEQRVIAHILGSLDDKIELNRKMNETLEAMARAIFKSWFIDFDPVRAKAEDRAPGLPKEIADLFPDIFEDSELGEIPKGWEIGTVGENFSLTMGQSPPGETYNEVGDGIPFFQGRADFGFRYPARRVYCTAPTRFASQGDTLVSVRAPVGDINMALEKCCVGRGVAAIRHKSGSRSYTYYAMHTLKDRFAGFEAEGTVFGSINKKQFENIPWIAPTSDTVDKFEKLVFPIDERIENNIKESSTLATIRDALLPKLISGEVRVKDTEKLLEGAA